MGAMLKDLGCGRRSLKLEFGRQLVGKGLPICLDPFSPPTGELDQEQLVASWDMMSTGFAALAGYDVEKKSPGAQIKAFLYQLLTESAEAWLIPT